MNCLQVRDVSKFKYKEVQKKKKKKHIVDEESEQEVVVVDAHKEDTQIEHKVVYELY